MDFLNDLLKNWKEWMEFIFPLVIFLALYLFRYIRQFAKTKHLKEIAPLFNSEVTSGLFSRVSASVFLPSFSCGPTLSDVFEMNNLIGPTVPPWLIVNVNLALRNRPEASTHTGHAPDRKVDW